MRFVANDRGVDGLGSRRERVAVPIYEEQQERRCFAQRPHPLQFQLPFFRYHLLFVHHQRYLGRLRISSAVFSPSLPACVVQYREWSSFLPSSSATSRPRWASRKFRPAIGEAASLTKPPGYQRCSDCALQLLPQSRPQSRKSLSCLIPHSIEFGAL